jgi:hypothetical protein
MRVGAHQGRVSVAETPLGIMLLGILFQDNLEFGDGLQNIIGLHQISAEMP